ncbi:MAG: type II toxin-antitoxin system Phd/YefM family antitoxin [Nitrospirae bacterium]|nr:type II toxin-antitoxin system Phd/YefM family antitoxin [Nitrospirota bacterium]MBF0533962.1 type II toxin-antitoxin system Phd/YefM family antitoxin [Nitrospirota bacterium]MBF0616121.1 type II toxin-antitoxin system Phd/YefM family antitoxin [Nitrospirota bacterium]
MKVNIHEAAAHLSKLINRVSSGEEIIIARAGTPIARLVPIPNRRTNRIPDTAKGKITVHEDFTAPLPDEIIDSFYK